MISKSSMKKLILSNDVKKCSKIWKKDKTNYFGNISHWYIPTDPEFDELFEAFNKYYDSDKAIIMTNGVTKVTRR